MKSIKQKLIDILKKQAELFLLDSGGFYPFGTYIDIQDNIKPISAYTGKDDPDSQELIIILEGYIKQLLKSNNLKIAAIVVDVTINQNGEKQDALEIRLFEGNQEYSKDYLRYAIKTDFIEFIN